MTDWLGSTSGRGGRWMPVIGPGKALLQIETVGKAFQPCWTGRTKSEEK